MLCVQLSFFVVVIIVRPTLLGVYHYHYYYILICSILVGLLSKLSNYQHLYVHVEQSVHVHSISIGAYSNVVVCLRM